MEDKSRVQELAKLLEKHAQTDGLHSTNVDSLFTLRASQPSKRVTQVYPTGIIIGAQGKKRAYLDGKQYEYSDKNYLALLAPMAFECEVVEASNDKPLLAVGIAFDLNKINTMLLEMERFEKTPAKPNEVNASGIDSAVTSANLLDAAIRLVKTLDTPSEASILGGAIVDEIYFRFLSEGKNRQRAHLLHRRGQIQQIASAVEHIHQHLDQAVSVEELAGAVNMSNSGFHKKFKDVMHMSPLQYAKSIKLEKAKAHIMNGSNASEASQRVGYNNFAQFSREYKRRFGFPPSATLSVLS